MKFSAKKMKDTSYFYPKAKHLKIQTNALTIYSTSFTFLNKKARAFFVRRFNSALNSKSAEIIFFDTSLVKIF